MSSGSRAEHSEERDQRRLGQQQQQQEPPRLPLPVWLAASVQQQQQPEPQQPQPHNAKDCLGCRIVGTVTLLGVSAYTWSQGASLPPGHTNRRFLFVFSGAFGAMAAARAVL